ncbi:ABC transporter ATP-binding protein [Natronomonas sp. EA1]|uniref:ABC transporter ATP-binding protein n=1 Tax=Natronomonas sp. EA1 TaxID=3421655 RepID=UPI003EC0F9D7
MHPWFSTDDPVDLGPVEGDPLARLLRQYGRAEWPLFLAGLVGSLLGRTTGLVPPLVLGVTIDAVLSGRTPYALPLVPSGWLPTASLDQLYLSFGLIVAAFALGVGFTWLQGVGMSVFSNRVQHAVRVDTYAAMQRLDMAFFDDKQTGQLLSVLNNDVRNLKSFLDSTVGGAIQLVVTVVGIAGVLFWLNAQLALVTLVAVPLLTVFTLWFMRRIRPLYRDLRGAVGELNTRLEANIGGMEVIKTTTAEGYEDARITEASKGYYDAALAVVRLDYLYNPTMDLLAGVAFAATFLIGGVWLVSGPPGPFTGELLVGEFVTFLFMTQRFVDPLAGVGRIVNAYENARASAERIVGLVETPVTVTEDPAGVPLPTPTGRIAFEDVSFAYREGVPVLEGVSFVAEPGDTVALVGSTGAGKSTVAKLLVRLYDVGEGRITVDGHDVRDLRLSDLRRAVGYVGQDVFLFDGSVRENVAYGAFDASEEDIEAAARAAEAHGFIAELPEGYDTRIGERGIKLSGGQRQRVSIARAMLQDPDILVLDEATSAVDTETEGAIQRALARLTDGKTTLVIAHRLSTVRDADTVLVIEDGTVVESGNHDELLALGGRYATLWNAQADLAPLPFDVVLTATED